MSNWLKSFFENRKNQYLFSIPDEIQFPYMNINNKFNDFTDLATLILRKYFGDRYTRSVAFLPFTKFSRSNENLRKQIVLYKYLQSIIQLVRCAKMFSVCGRLFRSRRADSGSFGICISRIMWSLLRFDLWMQADVASIAAWRVSYPLLSRNMLIPLFARSRYWAHGGLDRLTGDVYFSGSHDSKFCVSRYLCMPYI